MMPQIEINSGSVADALTSHDWEKPSSDVTNSVSQSAIADSLLDDDNIVGDWRTMNVDGVSDERRLEEWPNQQADFEVEGEEAEQQVEELDEDALYREFVQPYELNQILEQAEASSHEQEQPEAQPKVLTPAEVVQGVEQLKQASIEYGLVNEETSQQFAAGLDSVGLDAEVIDAPKLDRLLAAVALSGEAAYRSSQGDSNKLGSIHPDSARMYFAEFNEAIMREPTASGNAEQAAIAMQAGYIGFRQAVDTYGIDAPLHLLNPGEGAEWVINAKVQACVPGAPHIPREICVQYTNPIIENWRDKLRTMLTLEAQTEGHPSRRSGRTSRAKRFETNDEIFGDPEVLERIALERL